MTKLSDIQTLLLATAAARADGSLLPPPETLGELTARVRRSITTLLSRALVEEKPGAMPDCVWREEDGRRLGVFITNAGREAIGITVAVESVNRVRDDAAPISKIDKVLDLLRQDDGASLTELTEATGWLPHTTRAALTRLRQKGHDIARIKHEGVTRYSFAVVA